MDWGTFPHEDEEKGDWQVASWAVEQLEGPLKGDLEKPFYLSVGFFLPHVPCYVTQEVVRHVPRRDSTAPADATRRP